MCRKGIWSTRVDPHLNSSLKDILLEDRKDNCFFIETHKGMLFDTANELFRLRNDKPSITAQLQIYASRFVDCGCRLDCECTSATRENIGMASSIGVVSRIWVSQSLDKALKDSLISAAPAHYKQAVSKCRFNLRDTIDVIR